MHCLPLASFRMISLYFGFSGLIMICLCMDFFWFKLFLESFKFLNLWVNCFGFLNFFPKPKKFPAIISSYFFFFFKFPPLHSLLTFWNTKLKLLLSLHRFLKLYSVFKMLFPSMVQIGRLDNFWWCTFKFATFFYHVYIETILWIVFILVTLCFSVAKFPFIFFLGIFYFFADTFYFLICFKNVYNCSFEHF